METQNNKNKPCFFILGAPKCGTTSLSYYLSEHPNIFISEKKEPNYFSTDLPKMQFVKTPEAYLSLFNHQEENIERIGEASTWYLYSDVAVKNILEFNPDAKMIVMIRNPVEMAQSLHAQLVFNLVEQVEDFEDAWNKQDERKERWLVQYKNCCAIGTQLKRLMEATNGKNIKVILFDDFRDNPEKVYTDTLRFLEVEQTPLKSYEVHNSSKQMSHKRIHSLFRFLPEPINKLLRVIKKIFGIKEFGIYKRLEKTTISKQKRKPISDSFRRQLTSEFLPEVVLLEDILNIDLSHWKNHRS